MTEAEAAGLESGAGCLMGRYETEPLHVLQVRDIALVLFDGLRRLHGFGVHERRILDAAARLHDIGWAVTQPDGKGHHKESARLIREHGWVGIRKGGVELVALVARYHRKALPDEAVHEDFARLGREDRARVNWLAGLLRVADGLDRRHIQAVQEVEVEVPGGTSAGWEGAGIRIWVAGEGELEAEVQGGLKKVDLLERTSGCGVGIRAREKPAIGP